MTTSRTLATGPVANPRRVQVQDEPVPDEEREPEAADGDAGPSEDDRS